MAFRFRKRIKIAPGINLNLSKSGISTSLGVPGATVNVGKRGVRATAGIPGSGMFYQTNLGARSVPELRQAIRTERSQSSEGAGCAVHAIMALLGLVVVFVGAALDAGFTVGAVYCLIWAAVASSVTSKRKKELDEEDRQKLAAIWDDLAARFDPATATRVMDGEIMQGDSREIVELAFGEPEEINERVMKSKTRHVLKYGRINARSFAMKITLENDIVVGWEN